MTSTTTDRAGHRMLIEITAHRIIPVVVINDPRQADRLGQGLVDGGLPVAEVTLRTEGAVEAIRVLAARGDVLVGAGTVLTTTDVLAAAQAGARFVVCPGLREDVVAAARAAGLAVVPGAVTPSEITHALALGIRTVKFFPAAVFGGPAAIRALSAPFGQVSFIPTGGVSPDNLAAYLALSCVAAVGGSWMVPVDAVDAGDTDRIAELAATAVAAAAAI